jgi:hypothetical protein
MPRAGSAWVAGGHLDDWLSYYPGLAIRRRLAMRLAFVNRPSKANSTAALAPQRMEVQHPVIAGDHDLAVDQERLRLERAAGTV